MATEIWRKEHQEELRKYRRDWYVKNKEHAKSKVKERREKLKHWMSEMKSTLKCSCGEYHISCILFHHLDPKEKDIEVSRAVADGWSKKRILNEISKCKIMCSNCHRKLHWNEKHRSMV